MTQKEEEQKRESAKLIISLDAKVDRRDKKIIDLENKINQLGGVIIDMEERQRINESKLKSLMIKSIDSEMLS